MKIMSNGQCNVPLNFPLLTLLVNFFVSFIRKFFFCIDIFVFFVFFVFDKMCKQLITYKGENLKN